MTFIWVTVTQEKLSLNKSADVTWDIKEDVPQAAGGRGSD